MNRRGFLGFSLAAVGGIFVPRYERWYRQGSGLLIPRTTLEVPRAWAEYVVYGIGPGQRVTLKPYRASVGSLAGYDVIVDSAGDFRIGSLVRIHDETLN